MYQNVRFAEGLAPFDRSYTLARNVSAIQILHDEGELRPRLGLITQLPQGAEVAVGGPGFNEKTVQVKCEGSSYFVFLEDLELQRKRAASAGVG